MLIRLEMELINYNLYKYTKKLMDTNLPPSVTCIVVDAVMASSGESSMAVQDTSVPFRSDIGSGAVSVDVSSGEHGTDP